MAADRPKVVIDTNVLISAFVFGGKPDEVFNLALSGQIKAIISDALLAEFDRVMINKFHSSAQNITAIKIKLRQYFEVIHPTETLNLLASADDRLLEVVQASECQYIVTGDKELLELGKFRITKITSVNQFLEIAKDL